MVATELDPNDLIAIGAGARFKLTKRVSVNAEYYYVIPPINDFRSQKTYNPLSIGFDIETGGHVFQLFVSNSLAMIEKGFIGETTSNWGDGGVHFGFNISRVFALK
jgi:opacity protein-like surface antigen